MITNVGKAIAARRLYNTADGVAWATGQGIGTTAAAATDTALESERTAAGGASAVHAIPTASNAFTNTTTTVTDDTMTVIGTVAESATLAITESGLFNANTAGSMLCRQVFSAVNVVSGDSIQFTWRVRAS